LGKTIAKTADLGSKKAGLSSDFGENCMILKKISIGKRPFFGVCYISRKITGYMPPHRRCCSGIIKILKLKQSLLHLP
jgi:hypothetical protein